MEKRKDLEVLALDLDETVIPTFKEILIYGNSCLGTNFAFEDFNVYTLWEVFSVSRERFLEVMSGFYKSELFENLKPYPEAQGVVRNLSKTKKVISITARPSFLHKETTRFVKTYFPEIKKIISNGNGNSKSHSKLSDCLENNVKYLVEDNADIVKECSDAGIICFLPKRPWNKYLWENRQQTENITPIDNLNEIEKILRNGNKYN